MPLPLPPSPSMSQGLTSGPSQGMQQPSYGGAEALTSQPTGAGMSDPQTILAIVFRKMLDLIEATNLSFPGGEDKISEGLQQIGLGFNEKLQRMGTVEPQGPPTAA